MGRYRRNAELRRLWVRGAGPPTDARRVATLHTLYKLDVPAIAAHLHLSPAAVADHLAAAGCAGTPGQYPEPRRIAAYHGAPDFPE